MEEAVVTWFEVVFLHLPGRTEEQRWDLRKNSQFSGRDLNPTFRIRSKVCYLMDCDVLSFSVSMFVLAELPLEFGRFSDAIRRRMQYDVNAGL